MFVRGSSILGRGWALLTAVLSVLPAQTLRVQSRDGSFEKTIDSPVTNKFFGPQNFHLNISADQYEVFRLPSLGTKGMSFAGHESKVVYISNMCSEWSLKDIWAKANSHGVTALIYQEEYHPPGMAVNRYMDTGQRHHGSTVMVSTTIGGEWLASTLPQMAKNLTLDLILTPDKNWHVSVWGSWPFIVHSRLLNPCWALLTAFLAAKFLLRERASFLKEPEEQREWRWRLYHLIMVVELVTMPLIALSLFTGLHTDDIVPWWVSGSCLLAFPWLGYCTTLLLGVSWSQMMQVVAHNESVPAQRSTPIDKAKNIHILIVVGAVVLDVITSCLVTAGANSLGDSLGGLIHCKFVHIMPVIIALLLLGGQLLGGGYLSFVTFPTLFHLYSLRREGKHYTNNARDRLALWIGLSVALMGLSVLVLSSQGVFGGLNYAGASAWSLSCYHMLRIGTSWAQVSAVLGRQTPMSPKAQRRIWSSEDDSEAQVVVVLSSLRTTPDDGRGNAGTVPVDSTQRRQGWVGEEEAAMKAQALPEVYAIAMTVVSRQDYGQRGYWLVPQMNSSCSSLRLWRSHVQGSHAFVRLLNEPFLRVSTISFEFGTAAGHAMLSNNCAVIAAGEIETTFSEDDMGTDRASGLILRWTNQSGTYQPIPRSVGQSGLPLRKLWLYRTTADVERLEHIKRAYFVDMGLLIKTNSAYGENAWFLHSSAMGEDDWVLSYMEAEESLERHQTAKDKDIGDANQLLESAAAEFYIRQTASQRHRLRKDLGFARNWQFQPEEEQKDRAQDVDQYRQVNEQRWGSVVQKKRIQNGELMGGQREQKLREAGTNNNHEGGRHESEAPEAGSAGSEAAEVQAMVKGEGEETKQPPQLTLAAIQAPSPGSSRASS